MSVMYALKRVGDDVDDDGERRWWWWTEEKVGWRSQVRSDQYWLLMEI